MHRDAVRLALVRASDSLFESLRQVLGGDAAPRELRALRLERADDDRRPAEALDDPDVGLLLLEPGALQALGEELLRPGEDSELRPGVVAVGCADSAEAAGALDLGADLAIRTDASAVEVRSCILACLQRRLLEESLRRHASLILKDDLTGAYNRRFLDRCLEDEIDRARRFGHTLSMIFMDLDDLRAVNQLHGHAVGSNVLREAASRTIRCVRSMDKVVRYGGDEFCIVLPETPWQGALEAAERIRAEFAAAPFPVDGGGGVTLTASFGIASFPDHAATKTELIKLADQAMFQVKDESKNGILVASERTHVADHEVEDE